MSHDEPRPEDQGGRCLQCGKEFAADEVIVHVFEQGFFCEDCYEKSIEQQRVNGFICNKSDCTERPTYEFKIQDIAVQTVERYCDEHAGWLRGLAEQIGLYILSEHKIDVLEFPNPHGGQRFIVLHHLPHGIEARASITSWKPKSMVKALSETEYTDRLAGIAYNSPGLFVVSISAEPLEQPVDEITELMAAPTGETVEVA